MILQLHDPRLTQPNVNTTHSVDSLVVTELYLLQIYPPFLLVVGITGNMLTIMILRSKSLRHNFVALFLTYLAICNIMNLVIGTLRLWIIGLISWDIRHISVDVCKVHLLLTMVFHILSNWLMTAVTTCKFLYVVDPTRATRVCSKLFIHLVVFVLTVTCFVFELLLVEDHYLTVTDGPSGRLSACKISRHSVYHVLQFVVFFLLPGSLIIFLNIGIIVKVNTFGRKDEQKSSVIRKKERIVRLLAAILFACDIQILINELPYAVQHLFGPSLFDQTKEGKVKYNFFYHLASLLLYTNCSINFVIYCFFGDHFREELRRLFRPCLSHLCQPHSRWVESTVDEDSEMDEVRREPSPRRRSVSSNFQDLSTNLSLLNIFDSTFEVPQRNSISNKHGTSASPSPTLTFANMSKRITVKASSHV